MWNASNLKCRISGAFADNTEKYRGRADLFDLALATCLELRREQGEFDLLTHDEAESFIGSMILDRCERLCADLEAMRLAMDDGMRAELREAIARLPSPAQLAQRK